MKVRITTLPRVNTDDEKVTYVASSAEECRDQTDKSAYEAACLTGSVVWMGCVVAEPVR